MTSEEQEEPALRAGKSSSPVSKLMGGGGGEAGGAKLRGKEIQRKQFVVRGKAESRDGKTGQGRSRRVVLKVSWATRVRAAGSGRGPVWSRLPPTPKHQACARQEEPHTVLGRRRLGTFRSCIFQAGIVR